MLDFKLRTMKKLEKYLAAACRNSVMISIAFICLIMTACTKNFEDFNTDQSGISDGELDVRSLFKPLQANIFHNYQTAQNLSADAYSGYMMSPTPFRSEYNLNYAFVDGWNQNGFNDMYTYIMGPVNKIGAAGTRTDNPDLWAIALIIKVEAMHRVTDKFGPVPYSEVGNSLITTPYDTQQDIYKRFFLELDTAVNNLQQYITSNPASSPFADYDLLYGGDYGKWIKFANSLRLRLAMHIVKADPATSKTEGEKALANSGGLLSDPSDDAAIEITSGTSDLYMITHDWADNRLGASIATYLTGYNDPRLTVYASPATDIAFANQYIGIRIGINIPAKADYQTYASLNTDNTFTATKPGQIMSAAEVWFLKAEAALRGWSGAGDAKIDYETGIQVSMTQWGVSSSSYINDGTNTQAAYVDPKNPLNNSPALSTATIKWENSLTNEQKLEKIITQKWIAIFPEGQEAWTEYRRTGYPKLFPVVNNKSGGTINTVIQVRRLAYPQNEYKTNTTAVNNALQLLGGADNGGTRVWWDIERGNFQ